MVMSKILCKVEVRAAFRGHLLQEPSGVLQPPWVLVRCIHLFNTKASAADLRAIGVDFTQTVCQNVCEAAVKRLALKRFVRKGVREKSRPGVKLRRCAQKREEPVVDQIPADVPVRVCQSERGVGAMTGTRSEGAVPQARLSHR